MRHFLFALFFIYFFSFGTGHIYIYATDMCTELRFITRINDIIAKLESIPLQSKEQIGQRIDQFLERDIKSIQYQDYIEIIEELKQTGLYNTERSSKLFWALAQSRSNQIPSQTSIASMVDQLAQFVTRVENTKDDSEIIDSLNRLLSYQIAIQERYIAGASAIQKGDIDKVIVAIPTLIERLSQKRTQYHSETLQRYISVAGLLNLTRCVYTILKWDNLEVDAQTSGRPDELVARFDLENINTFDGLHQALKIGTYQPRIITEHYTDLVALFRNQMFFRGFLVKLDWQEAINSFIAISVLTHAKYPQLHLEMLLGFGLEVLVDHCDNFLNTPNLPLRYTEKAQQIKDFVKNALKNLNDEVTNHEWATGLEKVESFLSANPSARSFFDSQLPIMESNPELRDDARRYRRYLLTAAMLF